jgi:molybdate transport system regulatory protein
VQKRNVQKSPGKSSPGFKGRIWIDGPEGTFLGYGRITLLERIRQYGSITTAAKSMEMSYRHAWHLMDSMNRQAARPLIETAAGGKGGGGTHLTEEGERAVQLFWKFHDDFQKFLAQETKMLAIPVRPKKRKTGRKNDR